MFQNSFEHEVKLFLLSNEKHFIDYTDSKEKLDFGLHQDGLLFHLDVKEKRQRYNLSNWNISMNEPDCFIIDDLSVRKCLKECPNSGLLIRDNLSKSYTFLSVIDLAMMPKVRKNRQMNGNQLKGKWIINLNNGSLSITLQAAFEFISSYIRSLNSDVFSLTECYGNYVNEEISLGGITRQSFHRKLDFTATR